MSSSGSGWVGKLECCQGVRSSPPSSRRGSAWTLAARSSPARAHAHARPLTPQHLHAFGSTRCLHFQHRPPLDVGLCRAGRPRPLTLRGHRTPVTHPGTRCPAPTPEHPVTLGHRSSRGHRSGGASLGARARVCVSTHRRAGTSLHVQGRVFARAFLRVHEHAHPSVRTRVCTPPPGLLACALPARGRQRLFKGASAVGNGGSLLAAHPGTSLGSPHPTPPCPLPHGPW